MTETLTAVVLLRNKRGLHARASAKFCAVAGSFDATVRVSKDDMTVGGCSIMGLMMLGAGVGSEIAILAEGPQAQDALDTLVRLVEDRFGEGE
ncbi:MAG: HPr family phosphocarrier protein [Parvularculaceae bacterium]|nr:HPr family phosphocarrier protein [Parvularculaceae bacterium]